MSLRLASFMSRLRHAFAISDGPPLDAEDLALLTRLADVVAQTPATLLEAAVYQGDDLAELYCQRWQVDELTETARVRASVPLTWQAEEYQGQQIRYAPTPLGEGLSIAYTIDDEFVLVGSNRSLVKRMPAGVMPNHFAFWLSLNASM